MPRPERRGVSFSIDGREVTAPEGTMLVDAAKVGDIEIPVFCYEPKLGQPVGACRMCLVEIEGIPKLQTACSTPIRDGMVVHTQTERVRVAQNAVVEFLLINHPLDCPVCDKGGECPLQDITFGWGAGTSRFIEPKRHFKKPLELSPLIAIDRERCILCYRCVRYSQEVAEDYQLVLRERGAHSYVATFDGRPYVAPFSGNIIELCPVGALTSTAYRFRARPWEIEGGGSVCTLCPSQCNVTFTVRDERVLRVLARDHEGVDDGWLCDKGRFAYQAIHVDERIRQPMVRDGGELRPVPWERALDAAAAGLRKAAGGRAAALAGDGASNEEGFLLQRLLREGLGSGSLDAQPSGGDLPLGLRRTLARPELTATVQDIEFAHAVLVLDCEPVDDAPILDLRIRKGVRRRGVKLAVATSRPSALDANAGAIARFAPGMGDAFLAALAAALGGDGDVDDLAAAAGADAAHVRGVADLLRTAGEDVVVLWGERLGHGAHGADAVRRLLSLTDRLSPAGAEGAGLLEVPSAANGRGLREAGVSPVAGPGYADPAVAGGGADAIAQGLIDGELAALYLLRTDPTRTHPGRARWEKALGAAGTVIAHATVLTEGLLEFADVVFPAETHAEKEGTVTHPDGRVQRLRPAIGRGEGVRAEWRVIAEVARRAGIDLDVRTGPEATTQLFAAVPFLEGLTLEELGGKGVRWPERPQAAALPAGEPGLVDTGPRAPAPQANGRLRLGTFRSIWAAPEVEVSPALKFLVRGQTVELSPADAERLGLQHGDHVVVGADGASVSAKVVIRDAVPAGSAFLEEATPIHSATALTNGAPRLVEVRRA
jgi:NADH-quinone oxidoreductase subunit G